ncbi:hypothetical protein [Brevibacillus choshinensis]|uniref:hypothetical protein n=1 Tax=Brevibacillus choshinensis TaxID=54911 RepID=UPI002E1F446B|nr:hypothetical protein [Brevibacillus choshinensis]
MNEIKSFFVQTFDNPHPGVTYTWDWEVKLAKREDGKYLGFAQEAKRPHSHTQGWIETKTDNLNEAFEFMKLFCENKTR